MRGVCLTIMAVFVARSTSSRLRRGRKLRARRRGAVVIRHGRKSERKKLNRWGTEGAEKDDQGVKSSCQSSSVDFAELADKNQKNRDTRRREADELRVEGLTIMVLCDSKDDKKRARRLEIDR